MRTHHWIGVPWGIGPVVVFPYGVEPSRKEIRDVFSQIYGPYSIGEAQKIAKNVYPCFVTETAPFSCRKAKIHG